jgi:cytochrome b561
MLKNTDEQFGLISTYIHWISAVMVFSLFALGFWMVDLNYYSEWYREAPYYHKAFGLTLFSLTLIRIIWKLSNKTPKDLAGKKVEHKLAKLAHLALYGLLLLIMFSGYLISTADGRGIELFNLFTVPSMGELFANQEDLAGEVHEIAAYTIMAMVVLHVLAALKHHFIDKDETIKRITKFK